MPADEDLPPGPCPLRRGGREGLSVRQWQEVWVAKDFRNEAPVE